MASLGYAQQDLAYIHDAGFRDYALAAAPELLRILRRQGVERGLVIDLGSGSGRWARELVRNGYDVLGVDQSAAMIELARKVAPRARFERGSLFEAKLPPCDAITSMGESFNYAFPQSRSTPTALRGLFRRAFRVLRPGGVFLFDFATPERLPKQGPRVFWREGRDWAICAVTSDEQGSLRRHMTWFRKEGRLYRRGEETHELRLYEPRDLAAELEACGFESHPLRRRGRFPEVVGMAWMLAVKPKKA